MLCIEFRDDGGEMSAMTNFPVVDTWQPPGSRESPELAAPVAWQLLLVGLGVALLVATSVIAFCGSPAGALTMRHSNQAADSRALRESTTAVNPRG